LANFPYWWVMQFARADPKIQELCTTKNSR
jgi:hypothetical protein